MARNATSCAQLYGLVLFLSILPVYLAAPSVVDKWRSVAIYQLLTDRFAGSNSACTDLSKYCGGNFNGLKSSVRYVKNLGFDGVWISPVLQNSPNGYHGYWATNFSKINPQFGTASELKSAVTTYRAAGLKVMVDVVANHVGYVGPADVYPFNDTAHYHNCTGCNQYCDIPQEAFDSRNFELLDRCRLAGLPDLDQDNPFVRKYLLQWIKSLVTTYGFEGIRIDTVMEVNKAFWKEFVTAAGVFATGEANDGDPKYVGPYQASIPSLLSFPMYYSLRDVFAYKRSMYLLHDRREQYKQHFIDPSALATFVDSHDVPRFLSVQADYHLYYNALAWVLLAEGIPVVYYGTEAGFDGGSDPKNREPLWAGGYDKFHPLHVFLKTINRYRKGMRVWSKPHNETYLSDNCYAFTRGPNFLVVLTNVGTNTPKFTCKVPVPAGWAGSYLGSPRPRLSSYTLAAAPLYIAPQAKMTIVNGSVTASVTLYQGAPAVFIRGPPPGIYS